MAEPEKHQPNQNYDQSGVSKCYENDSKRRENRERDSPRQRQQRMNHKKDGQAVENGTKLL